MTLTKRQLTLAYLVSLGMRNRAIALRMGTTEDVIKNWMRELFDLTGMGSRLELALWYVHHYERNDHASNPLHPLQTTTS